MSDRLATVATFGCPVEANLARNRLEVAGIKAFLADEETVGMVQGQRTPKANMDRMKCLDLWKKRRFWIVHSQCFDCFMINTS